MTTRRGHRFSSRFYLIAILSFLFLLDGFALWLTAKLDYDRTIDRAHITLEKTCVSLEERVKRTVIATETILRNQAQRIREVGLEKTISSTNEREGFRKAAEALPDAGSLWLLDKKGNLLLDSTEYPSQRINFSEREYFAPQRDKGIELYIGPVVKGKITRKYSFTISHRINGKHGEFLGIVLAAIETDDFTDFLRNIDIGKGSTVTVFRTDGTLILRQPMADKYLGRNFSSLKLFGVPFAGSPSGTFESGAMDGVTRLVSYRKVQGQPLVVTTGVSLDSVLEGWRTRVKFYSLGAVLICLVLIALSLLVRKTTLREQRERTRELSEINQSLVKEIAERREAEDEVSRSNQRLARVLDSIQEDFYVLDRDWTFVYASRLFTSRIGKEPKDFIGGNIWEMFPKHVGTVIDENFRATMEKGEVRRFEMGGKYTDAWYSLASFPSPEGIAVLGTDVTARRRAEEALRRAHEELELRVDERTEELRTAYERLKQETKEREQAEAHLRRAQKLEALGTLSGGIAHDFNNILAAIVGFAELIRDHLPEGSRQIRHTQRILEASLRGRDLVRQMLTFSRGVEEERRPLRLSNIVEETAGLLRASIPTTVDIETNVRSESGVILGDPVQVQQVLMNLATNAAHAMREKGGTLQIELSDYSVGRSSAAGIGPGLYMGKAMEPGLYMRLIVRDTGVGMSPDIIDRIFDPFFTTKKLGEGTGLGLSVVLGIVKQYDGYITAESELGKGSTFTVYFPKVEETPSMEATGQEAIPTGVERILFVDDEEAIVEMGEETLAELGYEVICRKSSIEALELFRRDPSHFDLVITDQTMPDMTGMELAREMLTIRPDLPIILATGFSYLVDAHVANQAGIRAFAAKPLTKREIARTIRQALNVDPVNI